MKVFCLWGMKDLPYAPISGEPSFSNSKIYRWNMNPAFLPSRYFIVTMVEVLCWCMRSRGLWLPVKGKGVGRIGGNRHTLNICEIRLSLMQDYTDKDRYCWFLSQILQVYNNISLLLVESKSIVATPSIEKEWPREPPESPSAREFCRIHLPPTLIHNTGT